METRRIQALSAFTDFTGTGMAVFNAAKLNAAGKVIAPATIGNLPEKLAQARVDAGQAVFADGDALDHDGDGKKGGSKRGANSTRSKGARKTATPVAPLTAGAFTATYAPVGNYVITGPGVEAEKVRGKAKAEARLAELAAAQAAPPADASSDDAPAD